MDKLSSLIWPTLLTPLFLVLASFLKRGSKTRPRKESPTAPIYFPVQDRIVRGMTHAGRAARGEKICRGYASLQTAQRMALRGLVLDSASSQEFYERWGFLRDKKGERLVDKL